MPFGGLLTVGLITAGSSIAGSALGASAAGNAAAEQVAQEQKALDFQEQMWSQQQANMAPFLSAGQFSIGKLMDLINSGTFGPGSVAPFTPPTPEQAAAQPGYQFAEQEGAKGILEGAAAAGGSITGGTLRALDTFNTGLASTNYGQVYNQALSTYQQNLAAQAQLYQQLFAPAQLGVGATENLNSTGTQVAQNVGNLMGSIGNAQAAGTVGSANAWENGLSGIAGAANNAILLKTLMGNNNNPAMLPPGQTYNIPAPLDYGVGPG